LATSSPSATDAETHPVRALLITGGHEHEAAFYTLFVGYDDIGPVPVTTSASAFKDDLRSRYDVVIMYDFTRDLDEQGRKNLRAFVEGGKGVVVLHHALLDYQDWSWWTDEAVGGSYRLKREGDRPSSTVKNNERMAVKPQGTHPVLSGIAPFDVVDECYKRMRFSDRVQPLLTTDNPNSDTVLAWVGPTPGLKVVAIQLGHGPAAFRNPTYRALIHNAILWSSGRKP
jgi:type 1 glutamine amidotransferase